MNCGMRLWRDGTTECLSVRGPTSDPCACLTDTPMFLPCNQRDRHILQLSASPFPARNSRVSSERNYYYSEKQANQKTADQTGRLISYVQMEKIRKQFKGERNTKAFYFYHPWQEVHRKSSNYSLVRCRWSSQCLLFWPGLHAGRVC